LVKPQTGANSVSVDYPKPPFPPRATDAMQPRPKHGETSYKGSGN
jgi:hypothetical protein